MDYSKMSDPDVNESVGKLVSRDGLTVKKPSGEVFIHEHVDYGEFKGLCTGWKVFDPCNNPADAWSIITENNISIILDNPTMPCATANARDLFDAADPVVHVAYDKPLRAAMVVYLMIQEAK